MTDEDNRTATNEKKEMERIEQEQYAEQEQVNAFYDQLDRQSKQDFLAGNRRTPLGNNVLLMLGRLIQPQTTGYPQINIDMAFSNLGDFDMLGTRTSSDIINFCRLYGLKKSEYLERGRLATLLNSSKSHKGKTMDMFTHTVTKQVQEYADKTQKKVGFLERLGIKKKSNS